MSPLAGRRVLITGAAGGLGPSVVAAAGAAGARLVLVDVAQDRLDTLAASQGDSIESTHVVDLLDADAVSGFAAEITTSAPIDAIWHLVGGWRGGSPLQEQPLDDWAWLHDLLVRTTVHVARAFADLLTASEQGRFAIISAKEAQAPTSKNAAYATAKAASEAVVLALANGFKGTAATANVVVVPAILTPTMREKNPDKDWGTFVPAEQIAEALVYLSSPAGAKMNGQRIRLYSGRSLVSHRGFASDNYAGVHPDVLAKMVEVNVGHVVSYGDDPITAEAVECFRVLLGEQVEVFFVFNGTGANVTALQSLLRPWQNVICTQNAHINWDECGAPERFLGSKLWDVPTPDGKLTPRMIRDAFIGRGDVHHVQPTVVSITQSTELGTLYSLDEVKAIADTTHELGMYLHMDGARISNAAVSLGVEIRETTGDAGVDVLSFGGTKNGLMGGEAVVFFRPELAENTPFIRKQQMQLSSKMRFISAQFLALFEDDLWRHNAAHANAMAQRLHDAVVDIPGVTITQKVQANGVFAVLPEQAIAKLQEAYHFYAWDEGANEVRWMCSWDTTEDDIDSFARLVAEVVSASR